MRKNINKLATLVMTGALAVSMSFGAFAEGETGSSVDPSNVSNESTEGTTEAEENDEREVVTDGSVVTLYKDVTTDGKTMAPNTSFTLNVTAADELDDVTLNGQKFYDIEEGITNGITKEDAVFAPSGTTPADTYTAKFKINLTGVTFPHAGVYHYNVQEAEGTYEGITYDTTTYDMYVFVVNKTDDQGNIIDGYKISNIVVADGATKISTITNIYGTGETGDDLHDLYITKLIDGLAADLSGEYTFQIKVNPDEAGEMFQVYEVNTDGTDGDELTVLTSTGNTGAYSDTITVKNGTKLHVYGLTSGDEVVVKELEANEKGYTSTFFINDGDDTDLNGDGEASYTNVTDGDVLTIHNKKDSVTPTGVAMDIAPYALMVALAGGAAATFLRKKESFED